MFHHLCKHTSEQNWYDFHHPSSAPRFYYPIFNLLCKKWVHHIQLNAMTAWVMSSKQCEIGVSFTTTHSKHLLVGVHTAPGPGNAKGTILEQVSTPLRKQQFSIKMLPDNTGTLSIDDTGYKHGFSKGNTSDKSFITTRNNFAETKATSRLCSIP